jgi:hypothetical protein
MNKRKSELERADELHRQAIDAAFDAYRQQAQR